MKTKEKGIVTGPVGRMRKTNIVNKKTLPDKVKKLVDTVKEYKDPKGRQLSIIFMKLPNAKEFSEYYEVIKRPIDLDKIGNYNFYFLWLFFNYLAHRIQQLFWS